MFGFLAAHPQVLPGWKVPSCVSAAETDAQCSFTNTNSENPRVQHLTVFPHGPPPVCSLYGATFVDLELAQVQANFGNL